MVLAPPLSPACRVSASEMVKQPDVAVRRVHLSCGYVHRGGLSVWRIPVVAFGLKWEVQNQHCFPRSTFSNVGQEPRSRCFPGLSAEVSVPLRWPQWADPRFDVVALRECVRPSFPTQVPWNLSRRKEVHPPTWDPTPPWCRSGGCRIDDPWGLTFHFTTSYRVAACAAVSLKGERHD